MATVDPKVVIPKCAFCGGKGAPGERVEKVRAAFGGTYTIPVSHRECKVTVRTLSLTMWGMPK